MATNVPIPNFSDSISEFILLRWIKNEGDYVRKDEALAELETDKANTELQAPVSGVLHQLGQVGQTLKVGEVTATIDETAAVPTAVKPPAAQPVTAAPVAAKPAPATPAVPSQPAPAPVPADVEDLNPSVRPLVIEHKLNPKEIPATGPHGRLLKEDVLRYLEQNNGKPATPVTAAATAPVASPTAPPVQTAPAPTPAPSAPVAAPATPSAGSGQAPRVKPETRSSSSAPAPRQFDASGISREPMSKIRKRTALNLKEAQNTAAILTTFNEVDMSAIMDLRTKYKERFEKTYGIGLGFMSFFAKAVILALRAFPKINAFIEGDDIVYHEFVNLGVAVSTERGLSVPVLKNAQDMTFATIESEIKRLATAVRDGKLGLQELSGGTFTITNGGVFGSLLSTPILNPPQSGILGMHAINKRPVVINDKIEIRPMMYVALSYDHRIVDGRDSVSFLVRVKEFLEDPARLMLEI